MIPNLLDRIAGFFEKDFLFASFLPVLIFVTAIAATLSGVVGFQTTWLWIDSWKTLQKATAVSGVSIGVIVSAYVLNGLRPLLLRFWSGTLTVKFLRPFFRLGECVQQARYERLRRDEHEPSQWERLRSDFRGRVEDRMDASNPPIPADELEKLMSSVRRIPERASVKDVERVAEEIAGKYKSYNYNSLCALYELLYRNLCDRVECEREQIRETRAERDRRFGGVASMRATDLGNIIEAYNAYPYKRYQMEAEIFWPRLQKVIPQEFLKVAAEPRILLDFSLAMASLSGVYGFFASLGGPWLWTDLRWFFLALVAFTFSYIFYRIGVIAIEQYGALNRACFDLFRLELMYVLYRPHPGTLAAERQQWRELSQMVMYGETDGQDFVLRPRQ
ncbi:MAG: hypothetical protein M1461_01480 [Nitrospirae bacterium]|nr:hypothetical protein [Nitrospirota bacterium]